MPRHLTIPAELYRLASRSYANEVASSSNQANVEITLLVLLIILVVVTAFVFLM